MNQSDTFKAINRKGSDCSKWDGIEDKFGRNDILPLWVADMDIAAPSVAQNAILQRVKHPVYGYALYSDSFYQSIIDWYKSEFGYQIQKEWIVPEHGVVVSIHNAIKAFSKEGDGILIQTPIYPPFTSAITNHNRKVIENRLVFEDNQTIVDWEDFESNVKKSKIFLLCSPHNPSTRAWREDELERMVGICRKHNVIIVSDEIHSDLVFHQKHTPVSAIKDAQEISLVLHAPSKTFNIAGLNTSYLIIPNKNLRDAYTNEFGKTGLDNGNVFGVTALKAVYTDGKEWLEELKQHICNNSEFVKKYLSEHISEITVCKHEATFLMWLDCRKLNLSDDELQDFFINRAKLGLNSGISFSEAGSGFMRLNIGTDIRTLQEAMDRLKLAITELNI